MPALGNHRRRRLLHPELAAVIADLKHGEMVCISDAGSGTHVKSLLPLDPSVMHINLGVAPNVPRTDEIVDILTEVAEFEAAVVSQFTIRHNHAFHQSLLDRFGPGSVHEVEHFPDWYRLRDRARVHLQTGDSGVAAQTILVAGHPTANIPVGWLASDSWYDEAIDGGGRIDIDDQGAYHRYDSNQKEI